MRVVQLIDKLRLNKYFIERNNKTYFSPIRIKFNSDSIEEGLDHLIKVKGRPYRPNKLEKEVIKELDF